MAIESFTFDKGVNRKKGRIYLEDGENYTVSGCSFEHEGLVEARMSKEYGGYIDTVDARVADGMHRYDNNLYASTKGLCYGGEVYFNTLTTRYNTATDEDNLLVNGTFNTGLANWTNWSDANGKCDVQNGVLYLGNNAGAELITNGGFIGDMDGWTDISTGTGNAKYSAGTLELDVGTSGVAKATQAFTTTIGATYDVTFDASGVNMPWCVIGTTSGGGEVDAIVVLWGHNSGDFVATSTTTYITFYANIDNSHPHIDNVSCKDSSSTYTGWIEQQFPTVVGVTYTVTALGTGGDLDLIAVGTTSKATDLLGQTPPVINTFGVYTGDFVATETTAFIHFKSTAASPFSQISSVSVTSGSASVIWSYATPLLVNGNRRPQFIDAEKFTFYVDGATKKAFIGNDMYEWGIENPLLPPQVAIGGAGSPNGTYNCYYSYYVTFPNGKIVETALSPGAAVTASNEIIEWGTVPLCPYGGEGLTIWRRLYRDVSGVVYYVGDIQDNTTYTYTDNLGDAVLQLNSENDTVDYGPPPNDMIDIEFYLQRIFGVKDNGLYWSEPYQPFCFVTTSNINIEADNIDLVGVVSWGDQLWMPSANEWYRLSGTDPDTWAIRRTFTDVGVINTATIKDTKYGILGLWNDGVYLFDGNVAHNMTDPKLARDFFTGLDDLTVCYAEWDGYRYKFYYASTGSTVDSCFVIDFTHYPNYRIYFEDWIPSALFYYKPENRYYYAKSGPDPTA